MNNPTAMKNASDPIVCPKCGGTMKPEGDVMKCTACDHTMPKQDMGTEE